MYPLEIFCLVGLFLLMRNIGTELFSWRAHWLLAALISDWYRFELRSKMKKAGIKPRHQPLLSRLAVLPCKWLVMSAVMMSMWSVSMAGHVPVMHPVTLMDVVGCVCLLWQSKLPRKPPDPIAQSLVVPPSADGEGREAQTVNQLSVDDADVWLASMIRPPLKC